MNTILISNLLLQNNKGSGAPAPQPYRVAISFGSAAKPFAVANWNLAHTNDPNDTYGINGLIRVDNGQSISGFNLNVFTAFSDQASGGSTLAGSGSLASLFPANSARDYWYPASTSRRFDLEVPVGGLGLATVTILSNVTIGTPPHQTTISVGGVEKQLANSAGSPPTDANNILQWTSVNFNSTVQIISTDGTGISAINAMIIEFDS